jgi:hypothetical protein
LEPKKEAKRFMDIWEEFEKLEIANEPAKSRSFWFGDFGEENHK